MDPTRWFDLITWGVKPWDLGESLIPSEKSKPFQGLWVPLSLPQYSQNIIHWPLRLASTLETGPCLSFQAQARNHIALASLPPESHTCCSGQVISVPGPTDYPNQILDQCFLQDLALCLGSLSPTRPTPQRRPLLKIHLYASLAASLG